MRRSSTVKNTVEEHLQRSDKMPENMKTDNVKIDNVKIVTKKLYDLDAYETEFDAMVLSCENKETEQGEAYQVVLDQTLFFPEEGGQSPDKGTIQGIEVLDVQITGGVVYHTIAKPVSEGTCVHGVIDWKHRFSNMQQHSGEHIFSGLVNRKYGYDNVGFHLSDQVVTMDFNGVLTAEEAAEIEYAANEVIISNLPVQVTFPSKEELSELAYRSKIEIDGQVRIVTVPGVDVCACCAPHVRRTGEIGMLKVLSVQSHRGGVRISILCGFRALNDFRKKTDVIAELSSQLSANLDTLPEAVTRLKAANQTLKSEIVSAKMEYLQVKLATIPKEQEDVLLFEKNLDAADMRNAVNRLVNEHHGVCGIFSGNEEEGYQFVMGSKEHDMRTVVASMKEHMEVRGGGSAAMVQGSVKAKKDAILECIEKC